MAQKKTKSPATRPPAAPGWITVSELAKVTKANRGTVTHHLHKPGAPPDDGYGRYEKTVAVPYINEHTNWADVGGSGKAKELREEKLALEVDTLKRQAAVEAGQLVLLKQATEVNAGLWVELHSMLRQQLEFVLPPQYQGKTALECAELNLEALEAVGEAFRTGNGRLEALGNKASA